MVARRPLFATSVVGLATLVAACSKGTPPSGAPTPQTSATASAASAPLVPASSAKPLASAIPVPEEKVEAALNPKHEAPYAGPTGSIEGTITVSGDEPPKLPHELPIPTGCGEALATYDKAFREGTGRTLADALVTVTEYEGYLPSKGEVRAVRIHGCAYDTRTVDMTYGQRIEVSNVDPRNSYLPTLIGANLPAQLVAIPKGDAVKLYPMQVGHYALADGMKRTWMAADVFVLKYPTHATTGLDGHYRIDGIPVGKVRVTAYLPILDKNVDRQVEVKAGEATKVDLTIPFDAKKDWKPAEPPKAPAGRYNIR